MIDKDIQGNEISIVKYAMHSGAILGLFWIFKYMFLIITAFTSDLFLYLYYVLNVGTFLIIYYFFFRYKYLDIKKPKGTGYCLIFVMLMCFFASFFEGALAYAHYTFIDPAYFNKLTHPSLEMLRLTSEKIPNYPKESLDFLRVIFTSKIFYILSLFLRNIVVGFFLGLFMGFFSKNNIDLTGKFNNN